VINEKKSYLLDGLDLDQQPEEEMDCGKKTEEEKRPKIEKTRSGTMEEKNEEGAEEEMSFDFSSTNEKERG
jgi:hypothetical protein